MLFLLSLCFAHPQYNLGVEALKRKDIPTAQKALQSCVDDEYHGQVVSLNQPKGLGFLAQTRLVKGRRALEHRSPDRPQLQDPQNPSPTGRSQTILQTAQDP